MMNIRKNFIIICLMVSLPACLIKTDAQNEKFWSTVDLNLPKVKITDNVEDLVLVTGNEGAGKSTSINTLLGHEMGEQEDEDEDDNKKIILVKKRKENTPMAQVSLNAFKQSSLLPEVYKDNNKEFPISYCDCPAMVDQQEHRRAFKNLMIRYYIGRANSIKALACVIDYESFERQKGTELFENLKKISELIEVEKCGKNILWIFTKVNPLTTETHIIKKLTKLKKSKEKVKQELRNTQKSNWTKLWEVAPENEHYDLLDGILRYQENIYIMRPTDGGESRKEIIERISSLKKDIDKKWFKELSKEDSKFLKETFNNSEGGEILKMRKNKEEEIKQATENLNEISKDLKSNKKSTSLQEEVNKSPKLKMLIPSIEKCNEELIEEKEKKKKELDGFKKEHKVYKTAEVKLKCYFTSDEKTIKYNEKEHPFDGDLSGFKKSGVSRGADVSENIINGHPAGGIFEAKYKIDAIKNIRNKNVGKVAALGVIAGVVGGLVGIAVYGFLGGVVGVVIGIVIVAAVVGSGLLNDRLLVPTEGTVTKNFFVKVSQEKIDEKKKKIDEELKKKEQKMLKGIEEEKQKKQIELKRSIQNKRQEKQNILERHEEYKKKFFNRSNIVKIAKPFL